MPDGSPQLTQTWADTDGENIVINTVQGYQKARNIERDPRVAVSVSDPARPVSLLRGPGTGGRRHHRRAEPSTSRHSPRRYLGGPYPWYGGRDQVRVVMTITPEKMHAMADRSSTAHQL